MLYFNTNVGATLQTPVRNSDPMAVESRGDLASPHGSIVRIAAAHSFPRPTISLDSDLRETI